MRRLLKRVEKALDTVLGVVIGTVIWGTVLIIVYIPAAVYAGVKTKGRFWHRVRVGLFWLWLYDDIVVG